MKQLLALLFLLTVSSFAHAQKMDCHTIREGKFKVTDSLSGTTLITRTKDLQTEENTVLKSKMTFTISWINTCMYELRPKQVITGDTALMGREGDYLTVIVKEVKPNSYTSITMSNFSAMKMEREIEMVK